MMRIDSAWHFLKRFRSNRTASAPAVKPLVAGWVLLCAAAVALFAQETGVSAGGKWMKFSTEDTMTAAKTVRLELEADNTLREGDPKPKVIIFCTDGKLSLGDFHPNLRIGPPDHPSFWGRPQMEVMVRVDNHHSRHGWNCVNGHFLSMDKGTTRELIGASIFKVEFQTPRGPQIAEFTPVGLDLGLAHKACGLTPKQP